MQCQKCKKGELEIVKTDVNLDRKGIRVFLTCSDNVCEFSKILELSLDDIIGIGKSRETEAESKQAIANAMRKEPLKHGRKKEEK